MAGEEPGSLPAGPVIVRPVTGLPEITTGADRQNPPPQPRPRQGPR